MLSDHMAAPRESVGKCTPRVNTVIAMMITQQAPIKAVTTNVVTDAWDRSFVGSSPR